MRIKKSFIFILTAAMGLGLTLGDLSWVAAQEATDEFTLEEITVTAQKREENTQKVPIPMEVITGEDVKAMGKTDLDAVLTYVSGAIVSRSQDGLRVSLRGISDDETTFYSMSESMPTVAVNTDGVLSNRKDQASALFDIERVEILYGPQSTLYASNSPGGIVNIVTAAPKTDKYELSSTVSIGSYGLLSTEGYMNAPLTNTLATRVSFATIKRDGYLNDGTDDEDTRSMRFKTLYKPNDRISVLATAEISRVGGLGRGGSVISFINQDDISDPWTVDTSSGETLSLFNDQKSKKFNATMTLDMSFATITLVPSYNTGKGKNTTEQTDSDGTYKVDGYSMSREKGAEARISSSPDFFFKWIVGATSYKSVDSLHRDNLANPEYMYRDTNEKLLGIFGNITYPVVDNLRLTTGYRRSKDKIYQFNKEWKQDPKTGEPMLKDEVNNMDYTAPDYKVGFEYDLGTQSMLYGDYSTSYRMRVSRPASGSSEPIPEELKAYTLGAKNRFFDNKIQVNAAAYYYDYSGYEATLSYTVWNDTNNNGVMDRDEGWKDSGQNQNGTGHKFGLDLQTSTIITFQDILNLSVSYIDSEWTDLFFDYEAKYTDSIVDGQVVQVPVEDVSYNGKPMTNTPPWTVTLNYSHNFMMNDGSYIKASFEGRYQAEYRLSWRDSDYPYNFQEAHRLIDLSAVYTNPDGKISLSAFVKNLEHYAVKRRYTAGGKGGMSIDAPRTYGIALTVSY